MQNVFDFITANLPLVIGLLVFVLLTIGLVLALRTPGGRDAMAAAAVRLAISGPAPEVVSAAVTRVSASIRESRINPPSILLLAPAWPSGQSRR